MSFSELQAEVKSLSDKLSKEGKHRTRLSIHNEELQWKLKQNSERHHKTLQELSRSFQDKSIYNRSDEDLTGDQELSGDATVSPPASPKIKGIVETSDAVSWILEMDDDSPGQVASRAIRRVGSFRSSPTNALKRSKSSSQSNPLSQSASATSIMRQFSAETSPMKAPQMEERSGEVQRTRSKSMSVKSTVDRNRRTTIGSLAPPASSLKVSNNGKMDTLDTSFQRPIHSSSPYKFETSGKGEQETVAVEKKRAASKNLSFSRTRAASFGGGAAVTNGQAKVQHHIPTMEVQESAGEAMILHISDGEDMLSQNSSLTTSTTSTSSSSAEEETTAEKDRTAISVHQQKHMDSGEQGKMRGEEERGVYASLHGSSGNKNNTSNSRSGVNLSGSESVSNSHKWSPTRLMSDVAMEQDEELEELEEDDVFGCGEDAGESVV